jgi:Transglycosylase-like domain
VHLPTRSRVVQLLALPALLALLLALVVGAAPAAAGADATAVRSMRAIVDHYRTVTWTYERAAHTQRTPASYRERRTADADYLRWSVERWTRRAYVARRVALARITRRLAVRFPRAPRLHARLSKRVAYSRRLTLRLRRIYPGRASPAFARAARRTGSETLQLWQRRSAVAAVAVAEHAVRRADVSDWLHDAFVCIHRYEGPWDANSGNGYFGGLQMDVAFQGRYGASFLRRWGTADNWPSWAQIETAARAYRSGRGFGPWPSTARACGLI